MLPWMQEAAVPDLSALLARYDELQAQLRAVAEATEMAQEQGLAWTDEDRIDLAIEAEALLDALVDLIRDDTLPCAYCGARLTPDEQSAPPWVWPGFGVVSACYDCTGNPRPHKASGTNQERE